VSAGTVHVAGTRTFAAEVVDFARDAGLTVAGLLEPLGAAHDGTEVWGLPVGTIEDGPAGRAIVGTGDTTRRDVVARLERAGWEVVGLVHPRAHVAPSAVVAGSALIGPGVVVGAAAAIGEHVVIGRGALVGHHTRIAPFATLGPGANVAGNVVVEEDAFLAMACAVRDHVTIGAGALVAMGAVVVGDAAPGARLRGVPARP
jgi:acetyltransferase-like isoleucine patch superfamily enzyme